MGKSYISDTSACALKDVDNEWHEDESKWTGKKSEDEASVLKAKQDDEARERDIIAMREFEKVEKERLQLQKEQDLAERKKEKRRKKKEREMQDRIRREKDLPSQSTVVAEDESKEDIDEEVEG